MNKHLPIIIVVILLLLGGGVFLAFKNKSAQPGSTGSTSQTQDNNVVTSIKDALSKSLSLECSYKDESGSETKTYIKGGAVRADSRLMNDGTEALSHVIFKDNKMYTWDPAKKQGMVMTVPQETMEEARSLEISPPAGESTDNQGENFLTDLEKYKDACKPAVVADSLFTPPSDVKFEDLSSMFENLPTGSIEGMPEGFDPAKLKEQYAPEN